MDPSLQTLLHRLDHLSEQFRELREGVRKAVNIADEDPEMALTRARKVLEYVVRDVYQHRINEPPGTRPLENLLQRLVKDGFFPDRLDAYANTIRKLGNVGTHTFGETITAADVYQSLSQLLPILEWYFEVEHPEAAGQQAAPPKPAPVKSPRSRPRPHPALPSPSSPRGCGRSTPMMPTSSSTSSPALGTRTACPRASASGSTASKRKTSRPSRWASSTGLRGAGKAR